ncbi:MAG: glycosyltransferase [Verrucomicrobia bacterium]|nr:glycosyltransferase [Verrucomicrobiota bacterium]
MKLWEYMAVGLPVVISDFPHLRELVGRLDCGLVADPASPRAIADALRRLHDSPAERARLGQNGRRAVQEEYNWENQERKLLELYGRLLPPSPARQAC